MWTNNNLRQQIILPGLAALLVFSLLISIIATLNGNSNRQFQIAQRSQYQALITAQQAALESSLNRRLIAAYSMAAFAQTNRNQLDDTFTTFASQVYTYTPHLRSLSVLPNGVLDYIYPFEENKAAVGINVLTDPARRPGALRAIEWGDLSLNGPLKLAQGMLGVIAYVPIFVDDAPWPSSMQTQQGYFWGFVATAVEVLPLLAEAGLTENNPQTGFALRKVSAAGAPEAAFVGDNSLFGQDVVRAVIKLPDGSWELVARPLAGWASAAPSSQLFLGGGLLVSLALSVMIFLVIRAYFNVHQRTVELQAAQVEITQLNEQLKSENLRMGAELDVTRRLQRMILPTQEELQAVEGLEIAAYMEPAAEVGGDYYDVLRLNGTVKIGIGDVTDHGLESGVVMLMAQTAVRTLLTSGETNPERFLDVLNRTVYGNVQRMQTNRNLSLSIIDYEHGQVRLSGQHEELILVRKDGCIERVDTGNLGFPIGLYDEATDFFNHTTLDLAPGDGFVLYTDGIPEAENQAGEQYGLDRLCQTISRCWSHTSEAIKEAVIHDVRRFIGEQTVFDDITLVVVKQR